VGQIQQVTHAIKYSHPDAKGTSLNSRGNEATGELLVGTHTLQGTGTSDTEFRGGAADMPVLKFLNLVVNGRTLLARAIENDPALAAALPGDAEQAQAWMEAFSGLTDPKGSPTSHTLAKQLYWPLDDGDYHLLAPLFPTSLVHRVWGTIRDDRFSDAAKAAREARRNKQPHPHGVREYPHFALQKFGGTKPQNISQLNSERHGEAYLLAAVPPTWRSDPVPLPLRIESVFERRFGGHRSVRELTDALRDFLLRTQDWNNANIRAKRAELVALIRDELMQFAAEIQDLPPGWSAQPDCRLNSEERYWLDPGRALHDPDFTTARQATDWRHAISRRFANWLNARLSTDRTPMGDPEHREWHTVLEDDWRLLHEDLTHYE